MADYVGSNPGAVVAIVEVIALMMCAIFVGNIITSPQFLQNLNKISTYISTQITAVRDIFSGYTAGILISDSPSASVLKRRSALDVAKTHMVRKSPNLPAWKKLRVDMSHIKSGHMFGGSRNPNGNKSIFWGLTAGEILNAIHEAYNNASKLHTQGDRILVTGQGDGSLVPSSNPCLPRASLTLRLLPGKPAPRLLPMM